jgi:hypothetical protein
MQMKSIRAKALVENAMIWFSAAFFLAWFWDRWLLAGPHGTYRWIGMDFLPFWVGVRQMLHGLNPYSLEVTLKIQEVIYGGPAGVYDPMMFVYPAWIFLLFIPFSLMPLSWAVIFYGSTLILVLFGMIRNLASAWAGESQTSKIFWLLVLFFGALPFIIISATKGQLGYVSLLGLYFARRLWDRNPLGAGIALGFAIIKPTVTIIPVAGFLIWAAYKKNWRLLAGFSVLLLILFTASVLASGFWVPAYLQMLSSTGGMPVFWNLQIIPAPWNFIYIGYFFIILSYALIKSIKADDSTAWFSATVLAGIALVPMRWIYDLFLGILIPSEKKRMPNAVLSLIALAIIFPWILVFIPENNRWNFVVVMLPLVWSAVFIIQEMVNRPGWPGRKMRERK